MRQTGPRAGRFPKPQVRDLIRRLPAPSVASPDMAHDCSPLVAFLGALRARTAAHGLLRVPARPLPHKPSVRNRGRVVAGGGSWLDGANFPETPLSVSKIVSGPEHYCGARKGSRRRTLDQPSRCGTRRRRARPQMTLVTSMLEVAQC
jgi:hypothetical protein